MGDSTNPYGKRLQEQGILSNFNLKKVNLPPREQ
jgi:hypothetical protein